MIFSLLSPRWGPRHDKDLYKECLERCRTLACCARVCTSFLDPALDVLWRALNSIHPILQLLPITTIDRTVSSPCHDLEYGQYANLRTPLCLQVMLTEVTPARWARFQQYAQRVRVLIRPNAIDYVHQSVWMLLGSLLQGAPLLPRLVRLSLDILVNRPADYLCLLSPSLRNLELSFNDNSREILRGMEAPIALAFLQVVIPKVPDLETLLLPSHSTRRFCEKFVQSLAGFATLRSLHIGHSNLPVNHAALLALSHMSSLHSLHITLSPGHNARGNGSSRRSPTYIFPCLQDLNIDGTLGDLAQFFDSAELQTLIKLTISAKPNVGLEPDWKVAVHLILATLPQGLRSLRFMTSEYCHKFPKSSTTYSVLELFEPCLSFINLEVFEAIFCVYEPHLGDEDIIGLASAWPKLHIMCISYYDSWVQPSPLRRPTVRTLIELAQLAQRCPSLHEFEVSTLDVSSMCAKGAIPAACHRGLRALKIHTLVGGTTVDNLSDFALMLDSLFPRLDTNATDIKPVKCDVGALLEDVQAQRRQEQQDDTFLTQDDEV